MDDIYLVECLLFVNIVVLDNVVGVEVEDCVKANIDDVHDVISPHAAAIAANLYLVIMNVLFTTLYQSLHEQPSTIALINSSGGVNKRVIRTYIQEKRNAS